MSNLLCQVINSVVPAKYLDEKTIYHLQPSGRFVIGGPQVTPLLTHPLVSQNRKSIFAHPWLFLTKQGDAGVTGRKIIVDTYGGWGAHGGGAFSGKDFSKVDRSAAYAARWVAKSLVKAKLCRRVLVQVRVQPHVLQVRSDHAPRIQLHGDNACVSLLRPPTVVLCHRSGPSSLHLCVYLWLC